MRSASVIGAHTSCQDVGRRPSTVRHGPNRENGESKSAPNTTCGRTRFHRQLPAQAVLTHPSSARVDDDNRITAPSPKERSRALEAWRKPMPCLAPGWSTASSQSASTAI